MTLPDQDFDAAYCFGNSFSFFPRRDMQQFIGQMANAVKQGGHVAIHTENLAESISPQFPGAQLDAGERRYDLSRRKRIPAAGRATLKPNKPLSPAQKK
jgi:hypothetical protein